MSLKSAAALPTQSEMSESASCATGCSPSHRRARRFLMAIVVLLVLALAASALYGLWSSQMAG